MWRFAFQLSIFFSATSISQAADFSDAVDELNTCTLSSGVYELKSAYMAEAGALGFAVKDVGVEVVAIKMDDATFSFDGFVIKFECIENGCVAKQMYSGWPHKLLTTQRLNFYTFHYCVPESQERIYEALLSGD